MRRDMICGLYMMRQAIELLIKAGFAKKISNNNRLQELFKESKHNIKVLFNEYNNSFNEYNLNEADKEWLQKDIEDTEEIDSKSDLFRYPFKDEFMNEYEGKFLNTDSIYNGLFNCYTALNKMILKEWFNNKHLDDKFYPKFIVIVECNYENCHLWELPCGDGFHKHIVK